MAGGSAPARSIVGLSGGSAAGECMGSGIGPGSGSGGYPEWDQVWVQVGHLGWLGEHLLNMVGEDHPVSYTHLTLPTILRV